MEGSVGEAAGKTLDVGYENSESTVNA